MLLNDLKYSGMKITNPELVKLDFGKCSAFYQSQKRRRRPEGQRRLLLAKYAKS